MQGGQIFVAGCSITKLNRNKSGNVRIHVTLIRVRITIVAVEKQEVLHILSVRVSVSLVIQHVKHMRRIVLSPVLCVTLPYFHTYLISGTIFGRKMYGT
jgi:hypothetical protein